MSPAEQASLYRRISLHVAPPLILLYFVAFLDRVNIGFAALSMNRDLHIGDDLFGLAAGIFFLGYMLFAVPSNLMLVRFGARRWIAVLVIGWGILSGCTAFVHGASMYIAVRFLIGAAEAGFFPGVILYLTQWLPGSARAGIMALFSFSIPLSSVVGSPISARILRMGGHAHLAGWQWLFLLEALPAVLLGFAVPWILQPGPADVRWLTVREKAYLLSAIEKESTQAPIAADKPDALRPERLPVRTLLAPTATYFAYSIGLYALGFWVPRLLASHGVGLTLLGWLTAIPFAIGAAGMYLWSRYSDRTRERRLNLTFAMLTAGVGMGVTGLASSSTMAIAGLSIAAVGIFAGLPLFWAAFSQQIAPQHAAVGIAVVNSIGGLGGFLGPYATGVLLRRTHGYAAGLAATALCLFCGALLAFASTQPISRRRRMIRV